MTIDENGSAPHRGVLLDRDVLKARRRELGLTQSDLAEIAGLTSRTVQSAEAGKRVNVPTTHSLARALDVSFGALVVPSTAELQRRLSEGGYGPLPAPRHWVNREHEAAWLVEALDRAMQQTICIAGPPGIGKTALVRRAVAVHQTSNPTLVARIQCGSIDPARLLTCQCEIARRLGFAVWLPDADVVGREAFDHAFGVWLWRRACLLVLDDVTTIEQVDRFTAGHDSARVVVTTASRKVAERLAESVIELGPLAAEPARQLLEAELGRERLAREPEAAERAALGSRRGACQLRGNNAVLDSFSPAGIGPTGDNQRRVAGSTPAARELMDGTDEANGSSREAANRPALDLREESRSTPPSH